MDTDKKLKNGLSGFLRVKNEARFVGACIDSCINALDELVVVYNDCTDGTPEILEQKRKQYPDKIRLYAYKYSVYPFQLSKEEFELVKDLPEDSPNLFSTYSNFALSKVRYKYVIKIDSDQLYFEDEIKKWREICAGGEKIKWKISYILGWFFMMYFSFYRRLSARIGEPCLALISDKLVSFFSQSYLNYAKWRLKNGTACISLSGLNLFYDTEWYVPFDGININPPYNGEGDHILCRFTDEIHFERRISTQSGYYVTESFYCPRKIMFAGLFWFHLHALRENCWHKVKEYKDNNPEQFVPIEKFPLMTYEEVNKKMDHKSHSVYQRTLFALIHKQGCHIIKKYLNLLDNIE